MDHHPPQVPAEIRPCQTVSSGARAQSEGYRSTSPLLTGDLGDGPTIEQDVAWVTPAASPEAMVAAGREVEVAVLARAVQWHAEQRVLLVEDRTLTLV